MKEEYQVFLNKVPAIRKPWKTFLTILYLIFLVIIMIFYHSLLNPIMWYMPIITQSLIVAIVVIIGYIHLKKAKNYRKKYENLAYQYYFYHFMIPYLVFWYDLFFHPLFINGIPLFPIPISISIAVCFFAIFIMVTIHVGRAGFKTMTHGMDIYTVFPEETTVVRGEIYGFIRHPLYLSLCCGCFALAFIANNILAIIAAIIQLIPCIIIGKMEDQELIERDGVIHKDYIKSTAILFPLKRIFGFFKLIFFFR